MIKVAMSICLGLALAVQAQILRSLIPGDSRAVVIIRVVGEDATPIAGAMVGIGYAGPGVDLSSDTNGCVRYRDKVTGSLACEVTKPGYYRTAGELWSGPTTTTPLPPTNQYTVVLKRIVNRVSMGRRDLERLMPKNVQRCGLDLEVGDWLAPHGRGIHEDVVVSTVYSHPQAATYSKQQAFEFPGAQNGIIPLPRTPGGPMSVRSELPVPQIAPDVGYTNAIRLVQCRSADGQIIDNTGDRLQYLFRVRVQTNAVGEILRANVGWIAYGFNLSGPMEYVRFRYYFNPDPGSRSLEPESF